MMLFLVGSLSAAAAADVPTGYIVKMLPLLLNKKGHDALSPSLYDRDAYQVYLRGHTNDVSAIRFDVLWRAVNVGDAKLKLRLELRGIRFAGQFKPRQTTLEQSGRAAFLPPLDFRSRWAAATIKNSARWSRGARPCGQTTG